MTKKKSIIHLILAIILLFVCFTYNTLHDSLSVYAEETDNTDTEDEKSDNSDKTNDAWFGLAGVFLGGLMTFGATIYTTHSANKQAEKKSIQDSLEKENEFKKNAFFNFLNSAKKARMHIANDPDQHLNSELIAELNQQLIWIELSADRPIYEAAKNIVDLLVEEDTDKSEEEYQNSYDNLCALMRDDLSSKKLSQ